MDNIIIYGDNNHNVSIKQRMGWDIWVPEWEVSCRCGMFTTVQDFKNRPKMLEDREEFVKKYGEAVFLSFNNSYLGNIESAVALGLSHLENNGIIKDYEDDVKKTSEALVQATTEYINNPLLQGADNSLKLAQNNYKNKYYLMIVSKIKAPTMPIVSDKIKAEYFALDNIK